MIPLDVYLTSGGYRGQTPLPDYSLTGGEQFAMVVIAVVICVVIYKKRSKRK